MGTSVWELLFLSYALYSTNSTLITQKEAAFVGD